MGGDKRAGNHFSHGRFFSNALARHTVASQTQMVQFERNVLYPQIKVMLLMAKARFRGLVERKD